MARSNGDSNERLLMELDRHVHHRIEEILRNEPSYFTNVIRAVDILPFLQHVIKPLAIREQIECLEKQEGNVQAVRRLVREMQKFNNFALPFLRALVECNHGDMAENLAAGFNLEEHANHDRNDDGIDFIQKLLNLSPDSPPPYQPNPDSRSRTDQEDKYNFHREATMRYSPGSNSINNDGSELSAIHASELSMSSTSSISSDSLHRPYIGSENFNMGSPVTSCASSEQTATNNRPTLSESYALIRDAQQVLRLYNDITSDIHPSETCISQNLSRNETTPKQIVTRQLSDDHVDSEELNWHTNQAPECSGSLVRDMNDSTSTRCEEGRIVADSLHDLKCSKEDEEAASSIAENGSQSGFDSKKSIFIASIVILSAAISLAFLIKKSS